MMCSDLSELRTVTANELTLLLAVTYCNAQFTPPNPMQQNCFLRVALDSVVRVGYIAVFMTLYLICVCVLILMCTSALRLC